MRTARVCLAALPVAVSACGAQSANPYGELVFLQTQATLDNPLSQQPYVELSTAEGGAPKDQWNFCGAEVSSNLGGMGPDFGAPRELRYKKVLKLATGQELDMVVKNMTEYSPKNVDKNGETGCAGRVNVRSPGTLTMQFKLVAAGTNDFVNDLEHDFTVMDLDHSKTGMMEAMTTSGFIGAPISVITPVPAGDGVSYTFNGLKESTAVRDPKSPWNLTKPQTDASVGLKFAGNQAWEVTFSVVGRYKGGRNFLFTGTSMLQYPNPCGTQGSMNTETGECEVYQDPHIDGFDNPRNGPFLTRISAWDMPKKHMSLLDGQSALKSWIRNGPPSIDVNEYERGDFWLVKNEQLSIQGRYDASQEFPGGRSGLAALAVGGAILDGGIVTLEPKNGTITFFGRQVVDVAEDKFETAMGLVAIKTYNDAIKEDGTAPSGIDLTLPSGAFVHIQRYNTHLDAKIVVPRSYGAIDGQCGNWNGDATDDSLDAITERIGSTKVSDTESLFAKPLT